MPQLTLTKSRTFVLKCRFEERLIAKESGFRWDSALKHWYTRDLAIAAKLRRFADSEAEALLRKSLIEIKPWLKPLSPTPAGLTLLPHQEQAIMFALERNRCYLGLDPGLGKTIVAARVIAELGVPCVYVSPPFLVKNVADEFAWWAPDSDVHIFPDTMLAKAAVKTFRDGAVLIVDEAQRFKNTDAKRTQYLLGHKGQPGLVDRFDKVIFMSGTPMPNRPIELHPILSKLAPETIDGMNYFEYGMRYCAGHKGTFGWDFTGASNMRELGERVIGTFMLRQKKALLNLPPKIEEVFVLSDDMSPRIASMDKGIGESYSKIEDVIKARLAFSVDKKAEELHVASYRRLLGIEKAKAIAPYIQSILDETDESILVFGYHTEAINKLSEVLADYPHYIVVGDTRHTDRDKRVKEFQTPKGKRLLIGNYIAAGIGFTMTKATRVIMVEFDWVPGVNEQASDRAHRIGQTESVLVQYVVFKDSIDKAVIETLLRKRKAIAYV